MRYQEHILLFHCLGELYVEDVVVLSPEQKYFLQRVYKYKTENGRQR
jgi:hypothetical protein